MDFLKRIALVVGAASAGACVPDLDTNEALISEPTVLAVVAEPAEPTPGQYVRYKALVANHKGSQEVGSVTWYYCSARKPTAELGPVSQDCFNTRKGTLEKFGEGGEVAGEFPFLGCSYFGPNPPPPELTGGEPGRGADPDPTGGYRYPVMLGLAPASGASRIILYEQRFFCGLTGALLDTTAAFGRRYRKNLNPVIDALVVTLQDGTQQTLVDGDTLTLSAGEQVTLEASWATCDAEPTCDARCSTPVAEGEACPSACQIPVECSGQEEYIWFNGQTRELETRTESLSLAWYTTAGDYAEERTGVAENERAHTSQNTYTAPKQVGSTNLWVVIRDARGGVGFIEIPVVVR